jgi:hypothetical protein
MSVANLFLRKTDAFSKSWYVSSFLEKKMHQGMTQKNKSLEQSIDCQGFTFIDCRGTRIRTWDPLLPKQVR